MYLISLHGAHLVSDDYVSNANSPDMLQRIEELRDDAALNVVGGYAAKCLNNGCSSDACKSNACGGNACGGNMCVGNICVGDVCSGNGCIGNACFPAGCLPDGCIGNLGETGDSFDDTSGY